MVEYKKPMAPLIGADGNIFSLMAIARRTLQACGQKEQAGHMISRVTESSSYEEALNIIGEYVIFG